MKGVFRIENRIKRHRIDMETIEMVIHSYNLIANESKGLDRRDLVTECYNKKEILLEYLLDPIEIHIIKGNKYLCYEGREHRFHEPFEALSDKEKQFYDAILPVRYLNHTSYSGNRIKGRLPKEYCDEFYNMVIENDFVFEPLN